MASLAALLLLNSPPAARADTPQKLGESTMCRSLQVVRR